MTDSLKQPLVDKPELPEVNFDWTCENWEDIGQRLLKATIACSTEWQSRRPSPIETPQQSAPNLKEVCIKIQLISST